MDQQPRLPEGVLPVPGEDYKQELTEAEIMSELISDWGIARQARENYTVDFPSLDNLVDGVPINYQGGSPYVGDTTLAGLVRSIPRLSLQQLPVFAAKVNGTKNSKGAIIASWVLRTGVFNQDTFGKGLLSTMQIGAEQALTHGYAPFMTATGKMFDDFGTTMRVLHYADVDPEPGIQDANEAGCFYVVANLTKTRVRKIYEAALANPNSSWKADCLKALLEMQPEAPDYSIYQSDPANKKTADNSPTYQFVTKYDVGKGGVFSTFCPQYTESRLRTINNRSKFGYPRVQFLVIDPAPLTPYGMSRVRLASPSQNLMNAYYMNITSMLILNSKPPILKRGRFTKPVQLKQGALWEAQDQNAKAELVTLDNGSLQFFVPMAQQMSSQIQNMMGMPIGTSSGGTNSMGYSKTAPGVKMQQTAQDTSVNQITNILENFLRQYALVALDTYLSEQMGDDILLLDDEAKNALNRLVPNSVGEDNKFQINWEQFYESIQSLGVDIELSIGKDELEEKARADMQDMLVVLAQNIETLGPDAQQKVRELSDRLLEKTIPDSKRLNMNAELAPPAMATPVAPAAPVAPPMTQ